jgi:hypothetical protein
MSALEEARATSAITRLLARTLCDDARTLRDDARRLRTEAGRWVAPGSRPG